MNEDQIKRAMDFFLDDIREKIKEHGWTSVGIFDPDGEDPPYAYTIAFVESYGVPEIIVYGLPADVSAWVLHDFAELVKSKTIEGFHDGQVVEGLCPVPFILKELPLGAAALNVAKAVRGGEPPPAFQLVWPDSEGKFPWEEGFDEKFVGCQPFMWEKA